MKRWRGSDTFMNGLHTNDATVERYVIDTNCLIMMISFRRKYHKLWLDFLSGRYVIVVSNEILEEYAEVIARNIRADVAEYIVNTLLTSENVAMIDPSYHFHLIKDDEDDNKFVDCAACGNARLIVTNDRHFNVLDQEPFPKVFHMNIDDFLELRNRKNGH